MLADCVFSVVRKSSKWSSWHYVNESSDHSLLYQRLRCVCQAHTADEATLQRPKIRTQLRHCTAGSCPSQSRPSIAPPVKAQPGKSTTRRSHNEVLSDASVDGWSPPWSRHHHHHHQYCDCRDLGALRVCRRCPSTT